uniref:RNase H domain-containing protein n=1 Tax=Haemonchus contortus TaxID=6289 RepID=A0A7I4YFY5_HAECO
MATRLAHNISAIYQRTRIQSVILLSDSEIALKWLTSYPNESKVGILVKNRVEEIRSIVIPVPVRFGYVKTTDNSADCATRGIDKNSFFDRMWWNGLDFIGKPSEKWPETCRPLVLPTNGDEQAN